VRGEILKSRELLQDLIRFDTTNPPGNEAACVTYIDGLLRETGFDTTLLARDPNRPNLITRLKGEVNATIVSGGEQINVIPSEIVLKLDGRLLPGYRPEDLVAELRQIIGEQVELEVIRHDPGPGGPDMGLFETLASILLEADPSGIPLPLLLSAVSDARFFSRLGIQTYGFLPMNLPENFNFFQTIHGADERIPVEALDFGTNAICKVLERYGR